MMVKLMNEEIWKTYLSPRRAQCGMSWCSMFAMPVIALMISAACAKAQDAKPAPLNVVLILADDLGYGELGCYGQAKIRTPHLDQLAKDGVRLTQAYAAAPVCAPSRCSLLTGMHGGRAEIRGNRELKNEKGQPIEGQHPLSAEALTIAEVLLEHGYRTGAMGKWGLGPVGSSGDPLTQGFQRFFGYICQREAHSYFPSHLWDNSTRFPLNASPVPGHRQKREGAITMDEWRSGHYAPAAILKEALLFLDQHKDQPFFLYLPFIEPHVAMQPPVELVESYPEEWDDRPYRGQCGYVPHPRPRAGYAAMITDLDRHVGAILERIEALKLSERTLVLFTSDNGTTHRSAQDPVFGIGGVDADFFQSTRGLRGFKGSLFEGGIRVPFIARLKGQIRAGSELSVPIYSPDVFPTLLEAVGLPARSGLSGSSIWKQLVEPLPTPPDRNLVWVFCEYGGQVAVRIGGYKVIRTGLLTKKPSPWMVFDLNVDPQESTDLAGSKKDLIEQAIKILEVEMATNASFPLDFSIVRR